MLAILFTILFVSTGWAQTVIKVGDEYEVKETLTSGEINAEVEELIAEIKRHQVHIDDLQKAIADSQAIIDKNEAAITSYSTSGVEAAVEYVNPPVEVPVELPAEEIVNP